MVKDYYKWFVDTEIDDLMRNRVEAIAYVSDKVAVTAPKSVANHNELEQIKASNNVENVLADNKNVNQMKSDKMEGAK